MLVVVDATALFSAITAVSSIEPTPVVAIVVAGAGDDGVGTVTVGVGWTVVDNGSVMRRQDLSHSLV